VSKLARMLGVGKSLGSSVPIFFNINNLLCLSPVFLYYKASFLFILTKKGSRRIFPATTIYLSPVFKPFNTCPSLPRFTQFPRVLYREALCKEKVIISNVKRSRIRSRNAEMILKQVQDRFSTDTEMNSAQQIREVRVLPIVRVIREDFLQDSNIVTKMDKTIF